MYILIAGGDIVGKSITKALVKNHDVVVIDNDYANCEKIASSYGAVAVQGDATNINTLKEAGIEKCDYAIGVMGKDSQNLLFSLLCSNFAVKNIFVHMRDPEYRTAYILAGATNIGNSVQMMVDKFAIDIENPDIRRVISLSNGKAEVSIITLRENSKAVGQKIVDLVKGKNCPPDVVIAGMFDAEKDSFIVPRGSTVIEPKNQLFVVGSRGSIRALYRYLIK